jgi:hypothetical protein
MMQRVATRRRIFSLFARAMGLLAFLCMIPAFAQTFATPPTLGKPDPVPGYDRNGTSYQSHYNAADPMGSDKAWSAACDGDVMNTIFARAYLNAQQDIMVNQTLIQKPDSVFEYSCFDKWPGIMAEHIPPLFSESDAFKDIDIDVGTTRGSRIDHTGYMPVYPPEHKMRALLEKAIVPVLDQYIKANFAHGYLGGTTTLQYDPAKIGDGTYSCDEMNKVWKIAKCVNFMDAGIYTERGNGLFYEFEDLIGFDPRIHPEPCNNPPANYNQAMIDLSNNAVKAFSRLEPFRPSPTAKNSAWSDLLQPGQCENTYPIPTGLKVKRDEKIMSGNLVVDVQTYEYDEYTCPVPGCNYNWEQKKCISDYVARSKFP